ncbi:hypothetical protein [Crenothrix sp.]|uniref:hypothetical protein n=1 Tax=Crenothrix sp. TaxID=3100433 RepID=UPI00374DF4C3
MQTKASLKTEMEKTAMTKDEAQVKLEETTTGLQSDIDRLQARAAEATDDIKAELDEQIENLKVQFSEVQAKFETVKDATEESWEELKADIESMWDSASAEIKEEIEEHTSNPNGLFAKIKAIFS